jgi:hypothetical protein
MQTREPWTPEDQKQLDELLKRHSIENPVISESDTLPGAWQWLGNIRNTMVVKVLAHAATFVAILLIPLNAEKAVKYWSPKVQTAYSATKQVVLEIRQGIRRAVPDNPTNEYIAFIDGGEAIQNNGPNDEAKWREMTMVSSPTVPPHVVGGSGMVYPPYYS